MRISQQLNVVVVVVVALLNNLFPFIAIILPLKMVVAGSVDHCYSDIGCFPLSAEFYHPRHRPFNVRPWHRQRINTQFELFNRDHPEGFMMIPWDRENLIISKFNPKLETKIIVPGWLDNINRALWVRKLKDALLWLWVPTNIIVVRWTNFTPYTIATANTRVVGAELANLMKFLHRQLQYNPSYYHIIGHSLGAHIAGYCGDRVHGLGRITALDPARPFFQHLPKSVRLDRGDAKFVDAIHSDFTPENAILLLMSFGMTTPVGHVDFYPNGPPLFQPGCIRDTLLSVRTGIAKGLNHNSLSIAFLESIRYLTACDHQRSHEWFIESITNRECAFVGVRCNEFEGMINGRCTCDDSPSACAIMGIHADQMYLNNIHEELWPVRAGSVDYKYKSPPRGGLTPPRTPPAQHTYSHHYQPQAGHQGMAAGVDIDNLGHSVDHNYNLLIQAALSSQQKLRWPADLKPSLPLPPTKDEIYAQLKHQSMQMHKQDEPSILSLAYQDDLMGLSSHESASSIYVDQAIDMSTIQQQATDSVDEMAAAASEQGRDHAADTIDVDQYKFDQHQGALEDLAFIGYLRSQMLLSQLDSLDEDRLGGVQRRNASRNTDESQEYATSEKRGFNRRSSQEQAFQMNGHPAQYGGHPELISDINRDIESWYEDNGRWHLKTNNRQNYCSNQYQLLIFLGPLKSSRGRKRLRAHLLVSIIGSRGQLLNQRFIPRSSFLSSFTMQPFFILLEGSYSFGQIKSIALSWESRNDPDPVQTTVSFQSSRVQHLGQNLAAYQMKQFPWLSEKTKYDKTADFSWRTPPEVIANRHHGNGRLSRRLDTAIKSSSRGRYSHKYAKLDRRAGSLRRSEESFEGSARSAVRSDSGVQMNTSGQGENSMLKGTGCNGSMRRTDAEEFNSVEDSDSLSLALLDQPGDEDKLTKEQKQQVDSSLQPKQASRRRQRQDHLASHLARLYEHKTNFAKSQMPNQTYLISMNHERQSGAAVAVRRRTQDLTPQPSNSYFAQLIDSIDKTVSYTPRSGSKILPEDPVSHERKLIADLHNVDLGQALDDDSIVINQVIVSPLQAKYGRHGRNAKTFCPPLTKQKLVRDKTLRLTLSLMERCSDHHQYEQHARKLRSRQ